MDNNKWNRHQPHSLFPQLTEEEVTFISHHGEIKNYCKHSVLISEGDISDYMFILLEGKVKVYSLQRSGKEIVFNIQGPGEYFGELALIDESPRSASVMAMEPVTVSFVSKFTFEACLQERPEMAVRFLRTLTERVRYLTEIVKNLALRDVYGRVIFTLEMLSEKENDDRVIKLRLRHQDIASMVGSSREMVSKIMKEFTDAGVLQKVDQYIYIKKDFPKVLEM